MSNPLSAHPPWRQLLIVAVVLPAVIALAVLAFAWPAARIAPRNLPVGIVGTTPASAAAGRRVERSGAGRIRPPPLRRRRLGAHRRSSVATSTAPSW